MNTGAALAAGMAKEVVERLEEPVTVSSIAGDLRDLGLGAGDAVLVHSSLSALGWVAGGEQAVVDALQAVVTDAGTVVMPTHSGQYTDPAEMQHPPVPDEWVAPIRAEMPPYRPDVTPTQVGAIPECFRSYPGVVRSEHPLVSFAAWGDRAEAVATGHELDDSLGEGSPLARVYERDGDVLLLGVGHEINTSFHLAEYRADIDVDRKRTGAPVVRDGERVRAEYEDVAYSDDDFDEIGADFERAVGSHEGTVGTADAKLASQRALVDFAVDWLEANR